MKQDIFGIPEMPEAKLKLIYEGKAKYVYALNDELLLMVFKDDVTAFDGKVKATVIGKGILAARLTAFFFRLLEEQGIRTHFIDYDGCRGIVVKRANIIPLEVIVRNYAYGSLFRRMPSYKLLQKLDPPLTEFHYKDDVLGDPLVLEEDILRTGILSREELEYIKQLSLKINSILLEFFESRNLRFVDMKLEFGKVRSGEIVLCDEISGDTFRVLDPSGEHLDKEVFRRTKDPGLLLKAYLKLAQIVGVDVNDINIPCRGYYY
jgi:phosphoribosylaminoimidazole-succinocarboxamide synthase